MSPLTISLITFAFVFGGALLGTTVRAVVPQHNLTPDSKEAVKLGMALVATMAALVLGLLIASAKSSFDAQTTELTEMSSKIVLLDRILAHYGPEAMEARDVLRASVVRVLNQLSSKNPAGSSRSEAPSSGSEVLYDKIQGLSAKNDAQRSNQAQALSIAISLGQTRWLMYEQRVTSVSIPLLAVLIFWLTIIFISFGLFAPPNAMVIASFFVSAVSVSGAVLLILEMYTPYGGLIQISSAPLQASLANLGR
jgi:hypothetical protein